MLIFRSEPALGIGPNGYLLPLPGGNLLFENPAWYSEGALDAIAARGGVRWLAASHPHAYGGLWQVQERFQPEAVAIQREDLPWTNAFQTNRPYDEFLELAPGVELHGTGGHFDGHAVLFWRDRRILFAGDMVKFHLAENPPGISTHKGFNRRIPMSHAEIRRYREVVDRAGFRRNLHHLRACPQGGRHAGGGAESFPSPVAWRALLRPGAAAFRARDGGPFEHRRPGEQRRRRPGGLPSRLCSGVGGGCPVL